MKLLRLIQIAIVSSCLVLVCFVLLASFNSAHPVYPQITPTVEIVNKAPNLAKLSKGPQKKESSNVVDEDELSPKKIKTIFGEIAAGDSFDSSLRRYGIPAKARQKIISSFRPYLDFRKLDTNDKYVVHLDEDGILLKCTFEASPLESYLLTVKNGKASVNQDSIDLHKKTTKITGEINYSLFGAFEGINKGVKLLYAFADIFSSKIDFNTETHKGDKFTLIVDKFYKDNKFIGYGQVKYAKYTGVNGRELIGYYYSANGINGYFDQSGEEVGTSFLRSPVPMGRLTSRFTYRRKHPILGKVRPHLGIDLAAPIGTPILAAGDGRIEFFGRRGGYGRQIILSHRGGYKTYYGHLSRFKKGLKKGTLVKKKEVIGYVGSSGLSTGPHLDYRIKANGVFKDPFSVEFAPKSVLKGKQLQELNEAIAEMHDTLITTPEAPESTIQVTDITLAPKTKLILL